jgi:hypothetical protein
MEKQGISVVISWVLLVGLSVALAFMVMTRSKQHAQQTTDFIINDVEGDLKCADVALKAYVVSPPCTDVNISNAGYHTIQKVSLRHQFGTQEEQVDLLPQQGSKVLNIAIPSKVEIIPVVSSGNGFLGCIDKKVVLTC